MTATTRPEFGSVSEPTLYVAFELSAKQWKLALTSGWGIAPWVRTVPSGELSAVARVVSQARRMLSAAHARAAHGPDRVARCDRHREGARAHVRIEM